MTSQTPLIEVNASQFPPFLSSLNVLGRLGNRKQQGEPFLKCLQNSEKSFFKQSFVQKKMAHIVLTI